MLADRTLLGLTLTVTFAAGGAAGWSAGARRSDAPPNPLDARQVYARQLAALRDRGYDEAALAEALEVHQRYLDAYQSWWQRFCEDHAPNLDAVDRRFETDLRELDARVTARLRPR